MSAKRNRPGANRAASNCSRKRFAEPFEHIARLRHLQEDIRRQRLAERVHQLGPRPMLALLVEIADGVDLDAVLARYARVDAGLVKAVGADRFPVSTWVLS